ncbi:hypothetical protein ACFWWM_39755 [Streptomyces sp. NPDC058682]|uniref:hypothetical protein n=1 Tax=Streptomyces sp. NPDC058682 TaxID=3346596 RepID=UPI00365B5764
MNALTLLARLGWLWLWLSPGYARLLRSEDGRAAFRWLLRYGATRLSSLTALLA